MRFSKEAWHVSSAMFIAFAVATGVIVADDWPPELNLVFNSLFYWAIFSLCFAIGISILLYLGRVGSTRPMRALLSVLLILLATMLYVGFEAVASNTEKWQNALSRDHSGFIIFLQMTASYGKTVVAFGIAAFGANLLANTVPQVKREGLPS